MKSCINCRHARQVGDTSRQDVVGCALISNGEANHRDVKNSLIYEGWVYPKRRPGVEYEASSIGAGILQNFCTIIEAEGYCLKFEEVI